MSSETYLYAGIVLMAGACVLGLCTAVLMALRGRKLRRQLEEEYGQLK